jgi:hypothetical protein
MKVTILAAGVELSLAHDVAEFIRQQIPFPSVAIEVEDRCAPLNRTFSYKEGMYDGLSADEAEATAKKLIHAADVSGLWGTLERHLAALRQQYLRAARVAA